MQLIRVKSLWKQAKHNAFTDLCAFRGHLYCCFREATNHISADGRIRIVKMRLNGDVLSSSFIATQGIDYRDPKLTETPDGKLLLLAHARYPDQSNKSLFSYPVCCFSTSGVSWSSMQQVGERNWWLWRVRWHHQQALGFAYNHGKQCVNLFQGNPLRAMHNVVPSVLGLDTHGKGYPNESDIIFSENGTAWAVIRRDADTCTAQLGESKPPYKKWHWTDLAHYIGGPNLLKLNETTALVAGRLWRKSGPKTAVWSLDLVSKTLQLELELPSGGDTSYPGMVQVEDKVVLSYYSSHVDDHSRIYLADIALN